jgi:hypothetical protein
MACVPKGAVNRMTRLIGDADKAECKVDKLRAITSKLDEKEIEVEAEIFKALADPCRFKILSLLQEGELCVCEIMVGVDRPQSSSSHHLYILKDAGVSRNDFAVLYAGKENSGEAEFAFLVLRLPGTKGCQAPGWKPGRLEGSRPA